MSDQNKAAIRRLYAEIDQGNLDAVDELWAPDHVFHLPDSPPMDAAGHKQLLRMYQDAFGDWRQEITNMIAEGDHVVTCFVFQGTHKGEFMGIPPTDNHIEIVAVAIDRFRDGRVSEEWIVYDGVGMMQQLGAMPTPA